MEHLTIRELSRETAAALDRVQRGETLEVRRGKRTVARLVPVRANAERAQRWKEHLQWFARKGAEGPRPQRDPVEEFMAERQRRGDRLR